MATRITAEEHDCVDVIGRWFVGDSIGLIGRNSSDVMHSYCVAIVHPRQCAVTPLRLMNANLVAARRRLDPAATLFTVSDP